MAGFTINQVCISGNLTRDPELRSLPSGTSLCSLSVAVNERFKNSATNDWEDRPNYFDVTVWKGMGEWVAKNLSKGDGIAVQGRLRWRSWEDNNGSKRSAVDITADSIVPVPRNGGSRSSSSRQTDIPIDERDFAPAGASAGPPGADDDIPF